MAPESAHHSPDPVAFLDRQARVFQEQRRSGFARLGLEPGQVVLDAGCGPGTDTFELEQLVMPGGRIVGIDADPAMIATASERARERSSRAELSVGDVRAMDHATNTFDLVRAVLVLLHIGDPLVAVREMARVLRPGGQLVCIDPDHHMGGIDASDPDLAERVFRGRFDHLANPWIGRQLKDLFVVAGLVDVRVEVLSEVYTTWEDFNALRPGQPTAIDLALERGLAGPEEAEGLRADLAERDRKGRFFACAIRMRCQGTKPW